MLVLMLTVPWLSRLPAKLRKPPDPGFTVIDPMFVNAPALTVRLLVSPEQESESRTIAPEFVNPLAAVRLAKLVHPWPRMETVWAAATSPLQVFAPRKL